MMNWEKVFFNSSNFMELKRKGNNALVYDTFTKVNHEKSIPEILFVTSYPPRECGIATYTQDLIQALDKQFGHSFSLSVCALDNKNDITRYGKFVKYLVSDHEQNAFAKLLFHVNRDKNIKLVVVQHEFGLYAKREKEFLDMLTNLTKPVVLVFHTVLPSPNEKLKQNVIQMAEASAACVVMTQHASKQLQEFYGVDRNKITVINHGTHLVSSINKQELKRKYTIGNREVISTFGLLSSSKSIETTLQAMPEIIKHFPDVLFLVLGKTHPSVFLEEGERYRLMLEEKVNQLDINKNVLFINEYLSLTNLLEYLQLTDVYLFTSKDPNQAVSGTFSYAISCGCPVVSTPIPHAKEVLNESNGVIIDFENAKQLAQAVVSLLQNEPKRAEISKRNLQDMATTAWENSAINHALLFMDVMHENQELSFSIPAVSLKHIKHMTTGVGIIQFSELNSPDKKSGYTLDDNARALLATCLHYELTKDTDDFTLVNTYLQFIKYCLQENGLFINYVNQHRQISNQNYTENLEDSNGRAVWALGYLSSRNNGIPKQLVFEADHILQTVIPHVRKFRSTRAMAFIIKGLHHNKKNKPVIEELANRLVQMYKHEATTNWHWFESYLTYGNSILPDALLYAYENTGIEEYKNIAIESFDFLLSKIFVNNHVKVISNKGWHLKGNTNEEVVGGEQPLDVAYTILALENFYRITKNEDYKKKAFEAFNWFLGDNHLHQIVYNPNTGGCYDGIEEHNVNLNQGAESTISYLLARLTLDKLKQSHIVYANQKDAYVLSNAMQLNFVREAYMLEKE